MIMVLQQLQQGPALPQLVCLALSACHGLASQAPWLQQQQEDGLLLHQASSSHQPGLAVMGLWVLVVQPRQEQPLPLHLQASGCSCAGLAALAAWVLGLQHQPALEVSLPPLAGAGH